MITIFARDFSLGFIKVHILYHASKEPVFGLGLIEELASHGYEVSPGTIYPTLRSLETEGFLVMDKRLVGGKIRKYYQITPLGREALEEAKKRIRELVQEVLD